MNDKDKNELFGLCGGSSGGCFDLNKVHSIIIEKKNKYVSVTTMIDDLEKDGYTYI
jgi:hypothetical protein